MLDYPVEVRAEKGANQFLQTTVTAYKNWGNNLVEPEIIKIQSTPNGLLEDRITYYNRDSRGNPQYISKDDAEKVAYLWSYNYQYPIAKIENATLDEVKTALGYSDAQLDGLAAQSNPDVSWVDSQLRNYFNGKTTLVTTYTYKPLIGMTSVTDPRGIVTYYEYDSFGCLQTIKDHNNQIIENYEYHYKN